MMRYRRSTGGIAMMTILILSVAFFPVSHAGTSEKPVITSSAGSPPPVNPSYTTQCTKNHTDNTTPKLKECWEAPVEVQVVFIENDGVHTRIVYPANISVTFDNNGRNWSHRTLLQWKNKTLYTNEQGRVTTDGGFMREPNPETNNQWMENVTWNITVHFVYNLTLKDKGSVVISRVETKNITIPNNETENLTTNYSRWFIFTYSWPMLSHKFENIDDHWEAGAGIVAFIIIGAVPTVLHFQRKKELEETKRREKEARFRI